MWHIQRPEIASDQIDRLESREFKYKSIQLPLILNE